jgi:tetratricopeptide (TPR) repeat protein
MPRRIVIVFFFFLTLTVSAQETRVIDSLLDVLPTKEGREQVKTMIDLTWEFYDISFDDCIRWGEKALSEARSLNEFDLEAEANYTIGVQYAQHADLDLAKRYLYLAYSQYIKIDDSEYIREFGWDYSSNRFAFLSLWNIAFYELAMGNIDTAYQVYEKALPLAEEMNDTLSCAGILSNIATIWYNKGILDKSYEYNARAKHLFESIGDEQLSLRMEANMALICCDKGQITKAKEMYWSLIPKMQEQRDYYYLLNVCHSLGAIYNNELVDYDSAMFYLQKAMLYGEMPMINKDDELTADREKTEVMTEIGSVLLNTGDTKGAIEEFEKALVWAEKNGYRRGQMMACLELTKVYAQQGQAAKSLHYFERYSSEASRSGITMMDHSVRKSLILDYARLGRYADMERELDALDEQRASLTRENVDLHEANSALEQENADLIAEREYHTQQITTLQNALNHYRLAFFGLLAIALFVLVLLVAYKIVRKKRPKV